VSSRATQIKFFTLRSGSENSRNPIGLTGANWRKQANKSQTTGAGYEVTERGAKITPLSDLSTQSASKRRHDAGQKIVKCSSSKG
jgi:hypothetical protein